MAPRLAASRSARSLSRFPALNHDHLSWAKDSVRTKAMVAFIIVLNTETRALRVIP